MTDVMDQRPYAILSCDKGSSNYRVKRYRERAEELRTIADDIVHPECQSILSRLAATYDQMADREEHPRH